MTIYTFSYLELVCCSMSSSNCFFLTCIQVSQEAGQVAWYSHLSQNFPQFIVIHTVEGFGVVNKAEIDVFLELSCFFDDPADVGTLISGSSAFFKTSLNIRKFMVHVLLKPGLENLGITLLACEMSAIVQGIGMKTDLFQSCGHCWVFQICWHIKCSTFTASSFRIWNSSTGIPLPPLALFIVMLSKAHLTSHSRMSGSRWVITPSWLSCCKSWKGLHAPTHASRGCRSQFPASQSHLRCSSDNLCLLDNSQNLKHLESSYPAVLQVWSLGQQHQHHLGTC